jgi:hypothetical protein
MNPIQSFMNWISRHFIKKEYNYKNTKLMEAVKENIKKYQWKKGESFGKVVEVKEKDLKFTYFTDGTQIFNKVLPEFLEEIIGNDLPFPGADGLSQLSQGINITSSKKETNKVNSEKTKVNTVSPLEELVAKLSKKNIEPFQTTINLSIPKKDIFNMLIENADENKEELIETIANVAISQIEINKLQEYLKEEVLTFINNYYNG